MVATATSGMVNPPVERSSPFASSNHSIASLKVRCWRGDKAMLMNSNRVTLDSSIHSQ